MTKGLLSNFLRLICSVAVVVIVCASADASQPARTIGEVNFRKGPSTSEAVIGRLQRDAEVEVIERTPEGWYLILHQKRPGFVHGRYIELHQPQIDSRWRGPEINRLITLATVVLVGFVALGISSVIAPFLFKLGMVLAGCALWVLTLDIAFNLGFLYSLLSVALGMLIVLLFLSRKKSKRAISVGEYWLETKKAA